jgi:hypothetical protein
VLAALGRRFDPIDVRVELDGASSGGGPSEKKVRKLT